MLGGSDVERKLTQHDEQLASLNKDMAVVKESVSNHIPTALNELRKDVAIVRNWIVLTLLGVIGGLFMLLARGH